MASRIEDYGMIGNGRTVALVSRNGAIDWLCAPDFDSDACFTSLLGYNEHGHWSIRPTVPLLDTQQSYEPDSLVLVTTFRTHTGLARLIDFMPPDDTRCDVCRVVEGVEGEVAFELLLMPRFGYGADFPYITRSGEGDDKGVTMTAGPASLHLRADVPLRVEARGVTAQLSVRAGQRRSFQLTWFPSHGQCPPAFDVGAARARTELYWTQWADRFEYAGTYRDAVMRSLITLKALTYAPTGAVVAAPTLGLPEDVGGVRNWDYRFCWVRDASLTLNALMFGGYVEEAAAFRSWLVRASAGEPSQAQIMYDVHGGRRLTELELEWLPGYEGSRPVRIGNAASGQLQIDIFGELLSAIYLGREMGLPELPDAWAIGKKLLMHVEDIWQHPDDGIWEVRGGRRHFTYSKVMAWVAIDRALRLIEQHQLGGNEGRALVPHLQALREQIHGEVCARGFNSRIGAFTQSYGSDTLDASVLLMTHVGFLPASDPRIAGTIAAVERDLLRDGLVLRYDTEHGVDGLPGTEGAFLACSFWLADNYVFAGRTEEAEALFDRLLALRSPLGLLAEEWDPRLQRQVGNFPQGFSHLALVTTASCLEGRAPKAA